MKTEQVTVQFGAEQLIIDTGKIAKQANGSVTVQYGGTVVLVAVCMSKEPREGIDFFPLTVEYKEKTYAAGRIPGGFFKREGRPSESEILTSRLIDRPIRPSFPKGLFNEVQITALVLSSDAEHDPDVFALIGASAALSISKIPFLGPLGACRVARVDDEFVANPTYEQREKSNFDLVVVGTRESLIMLEGNAKEVSEEIIEQAIEFGHKQLQASLDIQDELVKRCGQEKVKIEVKEINQDLCAKVEELAASRIKELCTLPE
ncbi:polyribonucleotide nucleotidyltransferase, partial [Candidatus Omnitrophota bacterium]